MAQRNRQRQKVQGLVLSNLTRALGEHPRPSPEDVISDAFRDNLHRALSVPGIKPNLPTDIQVVRSWSGHDGVDGQLISYSSPLGGPKIEAYVLRPSNNRAPLPGVMALHCHGNFKLLGKEKIADDNSGPPEEIKRYRDNAYGGRAFANELAKSGYVVLVPDTFLWGSRRLDEGVIPDFFSDAGQILGSHDRFRSKLPRAANFDELSANLARDTTFEPHVESFLRSIGSSLAAVVNLEDRVSARVLQSLPGVKDPERIASIGLSGGGNRTGLLLATDDAVKIGVIAGMMGTYSGLRQSGAWWTHSWLFYPPNIPGEPTWEWPDIVGSGAKAKSLCCLNNNQDPLFDREGQRHANNRLVDIYRAASRDAAFRSFDYEGHHKFDVAMQEEAFRFLREFLI